MIPNNLYVRFPRKRQIKCKLSPVVRQRISRKVPKICLNHSPPRKKQRQQEEH